MAGGRRLSIDPYAPDRAIRLRKLLEGVPIPQERKHRMVTAVFEDGARLDGKPWPVSIKTHEAEGRLIVDDVEIEGAEAE